MQKANSTESVGIVGAGLVGSLLSIYLAKRGLSSQIYEHRPDMRREKISAGRSINLAVSTRGIHALREVGLEEEILKSAVAMKGRMIHALNGQLTFQPYGMNDQECIYSISRAGLNQALMSMAEQTGKVRINFHQKVTGVDFERSHLSLRNDMTGETSQTSHHRLFGTDGSGSVLRNEMMKLKGYQCSQEYLDYGYKELLIPAGNGHEFLLEKNALHIWPRGTYMLIALPNFDGSFTCTLFLPLKGSPSFEALNTPENVSAFFQQQFGDAVPLLSQLTETFFSNPTGSMVTIKCSPWHVSDRAALIGDAAHAIVPFFGQGMNCGFEDCTVLNEIMNRESDWSKIFSEYSETRKTDADRIADMAVENFIEMRDKVGNSRFLMEKAVEKILQRQFPGQYVSRYSLVSFSRIPYRVAHQAGVVGDSILAELCQDLQKAEDVDLEKAEGLIRSQLQPVLQRSIHGFQN